MVAYTPFTRRKLPYLILLMSTGFYADYLLCNGFDSLHGAFTVVLSIAVMLYPDTVCIFAKEEEFDTGKSLLTSVIVGGIASLGLVIGQMMHVLSYSNHAVAVCVVLFLSFVYIVDASRYL
jgi:hypothetical protein